VLATGYWSNGYAQMFRRNIACGFDAGWLASVCLGASECGYWFPENEGFRRRHASACLARFDRPWKVPDADRLLPSETFGTVMVLDQICRLTDAAFDLLLRRICHPRDELLPLVGAASFARLCSIEPEKCCSIVQPGSAAWSQANLDFHRILMQCGLWLEQHLPVMRSGMAGALSYQFGHLFGQYW
jgi:hypothetical protein